MYFKVRELITENIDDEFVPSDYWFDVEGIKWSKKRESKKLAFRCLHRVATRLVLLLKPNDGNKGVYNVICYVIDYYYYYYSLMCLHKRDSQKPHRRRRNSSKCIIKSAFGVKMFCYFIFINKLYKITRETKKFFVSSRHYFFVFNHWGNVILQDKEQ